MLFSCFQNQVLLAAFLKIFGKLDTPTQEDFQIGNNIFFNTKIKYIFIQSRKIDLNTFQKYVYKIFFTVKKLNTLKTNAQIKLFGQPSLYQLRFIFLQNLKL